jgi:hypothetical protein
MASWVAATKHGEIVSAFRQFYFREVLIIDISRP